MPKHSQKPSGGSRGGGRRHRTSKSATGRWTRQDTQSGRIINSGGAGSYRGIRRISTSNHGERLPSPPGPARPQTDHQVHNAQHHRQRVQNALVRAGLSAANPAPLTDARPLPEEQRKTLAQEVARGRPLSEYIREEREGQ